MGGVCLSNSSVAPLCFASGVEHSRTPSPSTTRDRAGGELLAGAYRPTAVNQFCPHIRA